MTRDRASITGSHIILGGHIITCAVYVTMVTGLHRVTMVTGLHRVTMVTTLQHVTMVTAGAVTLTCVTVQVESAPHN